MKPKRLTLISLALLAILLTSAIVILTLSEPAIKANVKWDPKSYLWDGEPPDPWNAVIALTGGHKLNEINTTTIRLEGTYPTDGDPYPLRNKLIVPFDGYDVKAALDSKLPYHMGVVIPGRYRIGLIINGTLLSTQEEFRGTGIITVTVSSPGG